MNMKRFWAAGLAATMALSLTACGSGDNNASDNGGGGDAASNDLNVGVLYYNYADTYIASVRAALSEKLMPRASSTTTRTATTTRPHRPSRCRPFSPPARKCWSST